MTRNKVMTVIIGIIIVALLVFSSVVGILLLVKHEFSAGIICLGFAILFLVFIIRSIRKFWKLTDKS